MACPLLRTAITTPVGYCDRRLR